MKNYKVIDHCYMNTGGNCMVSIFTVFVDNQLQYVSVDENGLQLSSLDVINDSRIFDLDLDETDFILDYVEMDDLNESNENYELYSYCKQEFMKKDSQS